jgi:hypothetical protein
MLGRLIDMLNSAKDYVMLDLTGLEGYVKGNVFPKVGNGKDCSYPMKYEDILFLQEAQLERMKWRLGADEIAAEGKIVPRGRRIDGSVSGFIECVCDQDREWGFVSKDRSVVPNQTRSFQTKYPGDKTVYDSTGFLDENWNWLFGEDCGLLEVKARVGGPILVEDLHNAYENLNKLEKSAEARSDQFAPWLYSGGRFRTVEASGGPDGDDSSEESDWSEGVSWSYVCNAQETESGYWHTSLQQNQFYDSTESLPRFAKSMKAVFLVSVAFENGRTYVEGTEYVDVVSFEFSRNVSAQSLYDNLMSLVLGTHGRTYMKEPQRVGESWQTTSVNVIGIALFVENDFPATP